MTDELSRFVRGTVRHIYDGGPAPGTPPDTATYGGGGEGFGPRASDYLARDDEPTGLEDDDEQLDDEDVADDDDGDELGDDPESYLEGEAADAPLTGRDVVDAILSDPEAIAEASGGELDAESWLIWAATCSPRAWREAAEAAGWDPDVRPGLSDFPRDFQTQIHADRLEARREAIERGEADYL